VCLRSATKARGCVRTCVPECICACVSVRVRYASARPVNHRLNAPGTADGAALNILITAELSRLIEGLLLNGYFANFEH